MSKIYEEVLDLRKLRKGMVISSYKELCKLLGVKLRAGSGKSTQLKNFKRYFDWDRDKYAYIITKKYHKDKPKPIYTDKEIKTKLRKRENEFTKNNPQFKIDYKLKDYGGVYRINLNDVVYIGSTVNFHNRYSQHKANFNKYPTKELMDKGALFELLWLYEESENINYNDFEDDEEIEEYKRNIKIETIRKKEIEFIKEYIENKEFNLINIDHNEEYTYKVNPNKLRRIYIKHYDFENVIKLLEDNKIKYKLKNKEDS